MSAVAERAPVQVAPRPRTPVAVSRRPRSPLRDRLEYAGVRLVAGVLGALPITAALRLADAGALVAYLFDAPHRRVGMRNLEIAFPEKSLSERRRILRGSYMNLGRVIAEIAHFPRMTPERLARLVRFEDEALWRKIFPERTTSYLALAGHFGNWELLTFANGMRGQPVVMVHRTAKNPLVDRWLNAIRTRVGTRLVRKSAAARDVLRALRDGSILVLPFDQNSTRAQGVFVDFFGLPASTNSGMARLALRTGTPILPAFIVREGRSARHVGHLLPLIHVEPTGDTEADVLRVTRQLSEVFEDMIRRHPEHWLWMHKRWKTRPLGEPRFY